MRLWPVNAAYQTEEQKLLTQNNIYSWQQTCMNHSCMCSLIRPSPACISVTDYTVQTHKHLCSRKYDIHIITSGSWKKISKHRPWVRNQPWLLEKCWKTSAQDALTTWPTSALGQHLISSHSVVQPADKGETFISCDCPMHQTGELVLTFWW